MQVPRKVERARTHRARISLKRIDIPPGSRDDVFIIRLAVEEAAKGTILVTADRPLTKRLSDLAAYRLGTA